MQSGSRILVVSLLVACAPPPHPGLKSESRTDNGRQSLHNGITPIATNENDLLISPFFPGSQNPPLPESDCSGMLLTNRWAPSPLAITDPADASLLLDGGLQALDALFGVLAGSCVGGAGGGQVLPEGGQRLLVASLL
jgi:hypothetical protein